jgi:hypothetical protein
MADYQVTFTLNSAFTGTTEADSFTIVGKHANGSPADTTVATGVSKADLTAGVTYTVVDTITGGTITSTGTCTNSVLWTGLTNSPTPTPTSAELCVDVEFTAKSETPGGVVTYEGCDGVEYTLTIPGGDSIPAPRCVRNNSWTYNIPNNFEPASLLVGDCGGSPSGPTPTPTSEEIGPTFNFEFLRCGTDAEAPESVIISEAAWNTITGGSVLPSGTDTIRVDSEGLFLNSNVFIFDNTTGKAVTHIPISEGDTCNQV